MKNFYLGLILPLALITSCKTDFRRVVSPNGAAFSPAQLGLQQPLPLPVPSVLDVPANPQQPLDSFMVFSSKTSFNYTVTFQGIPIGGMDLRVTAYETLPKAIKTQVDLVTNILFVSKTKTMSMLVDADEIQAGGKTFMLQRPKIGARWTSIRGEAEVVANEVVSTPVLMFVGCWKIAYTLNGETNYCWFAPNVGLVKMDFTESGKQFSALLSRYSI